MYKPSTDENVIKLSRNSISFKGVEEFFFFFFFFFLQIDFSALSFSSYVILVFFSSAKVWKTKRSE